MKYPPPDVQFVMIPTILPAGEAAALRGKSFRYLHKAFLNLAFFTKTLAQIDKIIAKEKPELAHLRFSIYGSTLRKGLIARRLTKHGVPYVLSAHSSAYEQFYKTLPQPAQNWIRHMFLLARGLIVLSELWKEVYSRIIQCPKLKVWILPNAVELPDEPITWSVDDPTRLLFLGRLGEHKGADRVLVALSRLPEEVRNKAFLYMAGDGDVAAMQDLAKNLGIEEQVQIRDWISGGLKLQWFRETNVFILPSRGEGLPNALLESMAWGKAVIVSPVGGIPEYVSDQVEGFLVPPDDPEKIARAIEQLTRCPEIRVQMGKAARARVEPIDIRNLRERLGAIYQEALSDIS
jgi:glycosyltransferase involved in cell wall biosynthesis